MSEANERSRLLSNSETQDGVWPPPSSASSGFEDAQSLERNHFAALRRHSSAGLQPEFHQHQSATRHWQDLPEDQACEDQESPSTLSIWTVVPILLLGVFVANGDGSLVIASSQHIASEFQKLSQASWLVTSYVLAQSASQPLYGKLSDIFGRKSNLITAYSFFTVGCFLCGIAKVYWVVIVGRVISGIGGAGMVVIVSIIVVDLVPVRNVAAWISYVNIVATAGRALGGPIGGWLTDTVGWRWSFFGQCPFTIVGLLLIIWKLPESTGNTALPTKGGTTLEKIGRVDFAGAVSLAGVIIAFLLTLEFVANELAWYLILIPALTFLLSTVVFYLTESRWAQEPVLPLELIAKRDAITPYLLVGFQIAAQFAAFYSVPIYFQIAAASTVSQAGLRLVPAVIGNATGGLLSGYLISKTGRYKLLTVCASLLAATSYLLMMIRWRGVTNWYESSYLFLGGFGMGIIQSTTFIHLAASLLHKDIAIAGSTLYLAQNVFLLIGLQIATTILRTCVRVGLEANLKNVKGKAKIIEEAVSSVDYIRRLPDHIRHVVVKVYIEGLTYTYALSLGFAIVGLVLGLTLIERRL